MFAYLLRFCEEQGGLVSEAVRGCMLYCALGRLLSLTGFRNKVLVLAQGLGFRLHVVRVPDRDQAI